MPVSATPEALRLVDQALASDGRSVGDARLLVLLGGGEGALLQALSERFEQLPHVLLLEPDAQSARLVREHAACDQRWANQLTIYGPEQLQATHDFVAAYLTVCQFLLGSPFSSAEVTCVVEPRVGATVLGRTLLGAIADLTRGLSREFLRLIAGRREFASVLGGIGKFFSERGEHYHALKFYCAVPTQLLTPALAQSAFDSLLALGNAELIEHWLREIPLDEPSRAELRQKIPEAYTERVAASRARLERNLTWLEPHFPAAVAQLRNGAPAPNLFALELSDRPWLLHTTDKGWHAERQPYTLLVRAQGLRLDEENPLDDLGELHAALVACAAQGQDHVWVGRWVRYAMIAVNAISQPSLLKLHGWRRVTFLQEHDLPALLVWLGAVELQPWFEVAQVRLTVGPEATPELVQNLEDNLHQAVPELGIGVAPDAKKQVFQRRFRRLARAPELFLALEQRYQDHPARLLAVLRDRQRPLRVVLMTSRYTTVLQHVTQDLAQGFEALGHVAHVLHERRPGEHMIAFGVAERLLELSPDLVFVIDHIRPEYAGLLASGLPVVAWVLDELPALKDPQAIAKLGSLDLTYAFNSAVAASFRALGYPNVDQLPFAVNPARYASEPPLTTAKGIGFTTHIGQFSQDPEGAAGLNAELAARFDEQPEVPLEMGRISPLLDAALDGLGLSAPAEAKRHLLYHGLQLARQQDRQRVAEQIVAWGLPLTVYGLGWDELPAFRDKFGGVVPPGPELRQVYRQHRAVLHINRGCNIHPRVLETMCSGGLVIARWDPLDDEPGETRTQLGDDLCLFHDRQEMLSLLRRALEDDAFRTEMIARGQARVLAEHTYEARARKVITDLARLLEQHLQLAAAVAPQVSPPRSAHV